MPALTLALVTSLALACHGGPVLDRVLAHALVESHFDPNYINDNTTKESGIRSDTPEAAAALARRLLADGHSIDAGLMQINSTNWRRFGLTPDTVFSPLANMCTGVAIIIEAENREYRISCIYNTGKPDCPPSYPAKIERAMREIAAARQNQPVAEPHKVSSCTPPDPTGWQVSATDCQPDDANTEEDEVR